MRLGLYIVASIVLMAIVGILVYNVNPGNYSYNEFGLPIDIPVAVWLILPMFILMLASVIHMMYYGTKNFFKFKKWEKETNTLDDALYWALLHEPKTYRFNIPQLRKTASLLSVATVKVNGTVDDMSEKLKEALTLVSKIDSGEYVDLRTKKVHHLLSSDNPLVQKNLENRLEKESGFTEKVLLANHLYSEDIFTLALEKFSNEADFVKARKFIDVIDKKSFLTMLKRVTREDSLGITKEILDEFIVALESELECSDYLFISTLTMKQLAPDENLILWREYETKYVKAQIAYLYLLFEYEMIDKAGDYLEEHDADDFKRFRALYDLKKEHKKYKITDLMNIRHICDA